LTRVEAQQRRLREVAHAALVVYSIGDARIRLLKYEDNAVYRVSTPGDGRRVLRITVSARDQRPALLSEMGWLIALRRDTNLLVPEPHPAPDGSLVQALQVDDKITAYCCLLDWIPGRELFRVISRQRLTHAGAMTARLHLHTQVWKPPSDFVRPRWDLDWLLGPGSVLTTSPAPVVFDARTRDVITEASHRIREEVAPLGQSAETFGLLHADLNPGNVIAEGSTLGIIDFDDCGWGYYLYDVAVMLCALRHRVADPSRYSQLGAAYLAGYSNVHGVLDCYLSLLPTFMAFRELVIMTFSLESTNSKVQQWRQNRLEQAIQRLQSYVRKRDDLFV
jgi:Ser/Thr protein kinase RdoA (MazF antagonist)